MTPALPGPEPIHPSRTFLLGIFEVVVLVAVMTALGVLIVPSHWTSIWMDHEFTGWVAPISNRMHEGLILYADGGHLPMPPLPFILLYHVSQGHATWFTESLLNFLFQAMMVLLIYGGLSLHLPKPVPFLAAFASLPLFFSLPKTIFYDALDQFFVAALAVLASIYAVRVRRPGRTKTRLDLILLWFGLAATAALTMLCKQSTGTGAVLGVAALIVFASPEPRMARRLRNGALMGLLSIAMLLLFAVLLQPYMDLRGFVTDIFLTGSEPKGGAVRLVESCLVYAGQVVMYGLVFLICVAGYLGISERDGFFASPERPRAIAPRWCSGLVSAYASAFGATLVLVVLGAAAKGTLLNFAPTLNSAGHFMLWAGLIVLLLSYLRRQFATTDVLPEPLAAMLIVLFSAAWFHSLSRSSFRWTYDNNPLISLVLAVFLWVVLGALARGGRPAGAVAIAVITFLCWFNFLAQYSYCRKCTESWPEVTYLQGARLIPTAEGMRQLVARVRQLAPDAQNDEVLLLPDDPNVESWFERRRPALAGAIIFTDQYWDRFVDEDFARLERDPPKVIVIGPRNFWRPFAYVRGLGCERFIDLVSNKLLPERYQRVAPQEISHMEATDHMDVYVRK